MGSAKKRASRTRQPSYAIASARFASTRIACREAIASSTNWSMSVSVARWREIARSADRLSSLDFNVKLNVQMQRVMLVLIADEMEAEPSLRLLDHRRMTSLRARSPQLLTACLPMAHTTTAMSARHAAYLTSPAKSGSTSGRQMTCMLVGRPDREHNRRDADHHVCEQSGARPAET
jgi:hypothetical protein